MNINEALEIIKRDDYARATNKLVERVIEVAEKVAKKLIELDYPTHPEYGGSFTVNGRSIHARYIHRQWSHLHLFVENEYANDGAVTTATSYNVAGDFNAHVESADVETFVWFANNIKDILKAIDKAETEKTEKLEKALQNME